LKRTPDNLPDIRTISNFEGDNKPPALRAITAGINHYHGRRQTGDISTGDVNGHSHMIERDISEVDTGTASGCSLQNRPDIKPINRVTKVDGDNKSAWVVNPSLNHNHGRRRTSDISTGGVNGHSPMIERDVSEVDTGAQLGGATSRVPHNKGNNPGSLSTSFNSDSPSTNQQLNYSYIADVRDHHIISSDFDKILQLMIVNSGVICGGACSRLH